MEENVYLLLNSTDCALKCCLAVRAAVSDFAA